ncbi:hypothetical protein G7046_g10007 [Stylonectria norvegica]|nr:hypothetical protein G7046_g10007 [Stylonectria norvegica]
MGVELKHDGEDAWALASGESTIRNLREYMGKNETPTMARRAGVAIDFPENLQYCHNRGIVWVILEDVFPELLFSYEPRYWVPGSEDSAPSKGMFAMELFALGNAICEITEWAIPYGSLEIEELQQRLLDGK